LSEAGLSYLGLGIQPPHPSWGKMLFEAQAYLLTNPWYAVIPGCMITLTVLGFNLLGDGLRDISDTKMV
jgi:peptide/nickel transport system permease protein